MRDSNGAAEKRRVTKRRTASCNGAWAWSIGRPTGTNTAGCELRELKVPFYSHYVTDSLSSRKCSASRYLPAARIYTDTMKKFANKHIGIFRNFLQILDSWSKVICSEITLWVSLLQSNLIHVRPANSFNRTSPNRLKHFVLVQGVEKKKLLTVLATKKFLKALMQSWIQSYTLEVIFRKNRFSCGFFLITWEAISQSHFTRLHFKPRTCKPINSFGWWGYKQFPRLSSHDVQD